MVEQEINTTNVEQKIIDTKTEVAKGNTNKTLKIFSVAFAVFVLIVLVVLKINNPDFPLVWVLAIGGAVLLICALVFFSFNIFDMFGKTDKEEKTEKGLPQPASLATLRGIAENALTNKYFANHTTGCLREYYNTAGKNHDRIYVYVTKALYSSNMKEGKVFIIINAHYPTDLKNILIDPTSSELSKCINSLSSAPIDEPNTEETNIFNPITQTYVTTKKVEKPKEEIKKEEKKEEDLK